jgi:hypothetical protein
MQQSCTYGSVRGAPGQPAFLPRQKGSECFESLNINGKSSMVLESSVRPETRRRTLTEFFITC